MASRKLQKDIDIIFKKIQEGLHDFNYHYERYDSINADEDSDNQREKEKLENDLKKEIKRLQKFREQIKIWQQNDTIKTLALNLNALTSKLTENKRLIEEAMEVYKDVERTSKLKTFSNQSILMATMDKLAADDDDSGSDSDSDIFLNEEDLDAFDDEDEMEDYNHLSPEAIEVVKFLFEFLGQVNEQSKKLDSEFEKLSHKKLRKNNLSVIESKKEKIKSTKSSNKFHSKKIMKLVKYIKLNKIPDLALIWLIKDDLNNYLELNSDANYEFDLGLYDDIFNLVVSDNYIEIPEVELAPEVLTTDPVIPIALKLPIPDSPVRQQPSPELVSPAIIKVLKPASTPSKPVGGLKWSAAAAVGLPDHTSIPVSLTPVSLTPALTPVPSIPAKSESPENRLANESLSPGSLSHETQPSLSERVIKSKPKVNVPIEDIKSINLRDSNSKFVEILQKSSLSNIELNVFSDMNMYKLPPGIQDLVLSYSSKKNTSEELSLLFDSNIYNPYSTPIHKPYLPPQILFPNKKTGFKTPLQYVKLQSYWNKIRAINQFEQLAEEIETMQKSNQQLEIINELTSVFFFGFYHGLTPIENLIAESFLFQLGWKPYGNRTADPIKSSNFLYWFKCVKLNSTSEDRLSEFGDYQVFDLSVWEFFVKLGFNFEYDLSQTSLSRTLI